MKTVSLARPEPLRGADAPSFSNYSVVTRLPEIARRTLDENRFPPEIAARFEALIADIPYAPVRQVNAAAPELEGWEAWITPYLGQNWLQIPWFFAEEYFYLRILEATGYFNPGGLDDATQAWYKRDPYAQQKQLGLQTERAGLRRMVDDLETASAMPPNQWPAALEHMLLADLWGNQIDLSMWPAQKQASPNGAGSAAGKASRAPTPSLERVLCNDLPAVIETLSRRDPAETRIDLLLDNAGYELAADLALADFLLDTGLAAQITLHAKSYPVFVSDAMEKDVHAALEFLLFDSHLPSHALAIRLRSRLIDGRLRLTHDNFWTSPLPMWELPNHLRGDLSGAALLICKGDANYRRLLGDRHWPFDKPFAEVVDYMPCAVLALRALKSEITLGVPPERRPTASDPKWMINGRWGLIQFAPAYAAGSRPTNP